MVLGWDIGGVNTKAALVRDGRLVACRDAPFELQRAPDRLAGLLRSLAAALDTPAHTPHVVTMTAELSQRFRTKREGVAFVLDAVEAAFPDAQVRVFTVDATFIDPAAARHDPLRVAASNWMATARFVARTSRDALLIDVGTTTTDIVPIRNGEVIACGSTDPERLGTGALVYCGAVRTPIEALVSHVPVRGVLTGVSAEGFALAGDAHVWLRALAPEGYSAPTPDGRPATREYAGERLARVVCADRDMLDAEVITEIAEAVADAQVDRLATAVRRLRGAVAPGAPAIVTGRGAFIAAAAARRAGLQPQPLPLASDDAAQCAPAAAAAWLYEQEPVGDARREAAARPASTPSLVPVVLKVGGGALRSATDLEALVAQLDRMTGAPVVIVPGGGPFADTVRAVDAKVHLPDSTAHWMAILGMDQYAEVLAARLARATLVHDPESIAEALAGGRLPVLAPSAWLRREDPLPHSWDVTADSIAAWVAGQLGARSLLLLKPQGASGELVDPYFARACPAGLRVTTLSMDRLDELPACLAVSCERAI